ncbi:MAG: membrane protein insertion efficiency factor YidD [Candidatus Kerfeldbacteria bacterium]|nr:membrane protein insertion efficiency factor YidD [Candidatus Kerfeldbacteria bacterium]
MKRPLITMIRLYQRVFSPDHGLFSGYTMAGCRYYPSCSEYMIRSIQVQGTILGVARGLWRIIRCNPFSRGGVDEPFKPTIHIL